MNAIILAAWLSATPDTAEPASAEPAAIPTVSREAPCSMRGIAAICSSAWAPGLHARMVTQRYQIRMAETGATLFEGRGLYRLHEGGNIDGFWEDSQGSLHPLSGSWDGSTLKVIWGSAETEVGRSHYQFTGDGGLSVKDWVQSDEQSWRLFMAVEYPAPAAP